MNPNGRNANEKRQQAEDVYRSMDARIKEDRKLNQIANFESSSTLRIDANARKDRINDLKRPGESILQHRRQMLSDLYNDEFDSWKEEVMTNVETPEDKKARMIERAYAVLDARKETQQKFVKERYQEQWRESCDDIRVRDSKAMTLQISKVRVKQICEKDAIKVQLSMEDDLIQDEWTKQTERSHVIQVEKAIKKQHSDLVAGVGLNQQVQLRHEFDDDSQLKKDEEYKREQDEADEEVQRMRDAVKEDAENKHRRQETAHAGGRAALRRNQEDKVKEMEEVQVQRNQDKILLEYALYGEEQAIMAESSRKQAIRQAAKQFAEHFQGRSSQELNDIKYGEGVRKREEEKLWQARETELQHRQDASDYLTRMVTNGRQEQIRLKSDQSNRDRLEADIFAAQYAADTREGVEREKADASRRRIANIDNSDKILNQISHRREKEEIENQAVYLSEKRMKAVERSHQQRVAEQGASLKANFPLRSTQWEP